MEQAKEEVKIEIGIVKITCPSVETAITILRSTRVNIVPDVVYPNHERARSSYGPPISSSARPHEGEAFNAYAGRDDQRDIEAEAEEYALWEEEQGIREPNDVGSGYDYEAEIVESNHEIPEVEYEDESDRIDEQASMQHDLDAVNERRLRHLGTRGRVREVAEDGGTDNPIFIDVDGLSKRTKRVFDFIQTRLVFSTEDVQEHMREEYDTPLSRKNKKKILKSLKTLRDAGCIEEGSFDGQWKKVA